MPIPRPRKSVRCVDRCIDRDQSINTMNSNFRRWAPLLLLACGSAQAHFFAQPYTLPVPFTMYAYGAATALALSFVVVGWFAAIPIRLHVMNVADDLQQRRRPVVGRLVGRLMSVGLLWLCVMTGLLGTQNAFANFNMTFFWICFVLGAPYTAALFGDFYARVNPWLTLVEWLEKGSGLSFEGRTQYPTRLAYYPALLLYFAFIWIELFGHLLPRGLSVVLLIYTAMNLVGAYLIGKDAWFTYCEFFAVFMRLIGRMAVIDTSHRSPRVNNSGGNLRAPFLGLIEEPASHISLVMFILFMLSSTAFDGLHSTLPWVNIFWKGIYPSIAPWSSVLPGDQYAVSVQIYKVWQWLSLAISPFIYLAVLAIFIWIARVATASRYSLLELTLRFAPSLVPIAFVYHATHYYTVFLAQAGQIVKLASDPFGFGWDVFGTAKMLAAPLMIDVSTIWHTQVALIVLGHIASVYLAHVEALRLFTTSRQAAVSQLPMLLLMMLFTTMGLWILSLPLASGS